MKKTVLITGASTGIGFAIAEKLQKENFTVFAGARKAHDLEKLKSIGCIPIELDVLKDDHIESAFQLIQKNGGLDALVNNAGVAVVGPVEAVPMIELQHQMNVNFFSVYKITQKFLPMLRQSKGRIVNMGSISGKVAPALFTPYSCSKFAMEAFSDGLRRETSALGIKVSLIQPGSVDTPIWKKSKATNEVTLQTMSKEITDIYSDQIDKLRKTVDHAEKNAVNVSYVSGAVHNALTCKSPKIRYVIGKDAKMASIFVRIFPDFILDKLVRVV